MSKRFTGILFMLVLTCLCYHPVSAASSFPDTHGHWAEDAINFLYEKEVVNGLPNGKFGVSDSIKRKDAALMIARAKGLELVNISNRISFTDLEEGSYYYDAVVAAVIAGYITGYPNGMFAPEEDLTREQMAKILVEAYDLKNLGGPVFKDVPISRWSYDAIQTLVSNKMTNGLPGLTFGPEKKITRSEFAMMLARAEDERFKVKDFMIENSFATVAEEAHYVIKNYSPDLYDMIQTVATSERNTIDQLISRWSEVELFRTINTAAHEIAKVYQMKDFSEYRDGKLYYTFTHRINSKPYVVSHQKEKIYPSELMGETVPKQLQTYRWETYVAPGTGNKVSNQSGVYGMLVELEAYYVGDKAAYDSYNYLLTLPYESSKWLNYYVSMGGTAFYEFTYYILNYLKYAEEHKPDVYKYIMEDEHFKTAFKHIYTNYETLVSKLHSTRKTQMIKDLRERGVVARIEGPYLYINGQGRGPYVEAELVNVQNELKKKEYIQLLKELTE